MAPKVLKNALYDPAGIPRKDFNRFILAWLRERCTLKEHRSPKAFTSTRIRYDSNLASLTTKGKLQNLDAHRLLLSDLTSIISQVDLSAELQKRLPPGLINPGGIRTTVSQGVLKNTGENFVNIIVYALANLLSHQDEVLIDKGPPPLLRKTLSLRRRFGGTHEQRVLSLGIETDFCIFQRSTPLNAIIASAKTRLKEVFHVGTMWKILFDMIGDRYCKRKWGLSSRGDVKQIHYVFATSDGIRETGANTQGPDLKPDGVRNLIAADASFFDYVFVSKPGIKYVSKTLDLAAGRECLFHELGCLIDLIQQKYSPLGLRL